ncbi:uncharacterized protein DS421_11g324960 [Arachis hypogaea]|nr:uncharacterized protein DS421_11g324960 [Arachis hypogaea]
MDEKMGEHLDPTPPDLHSVDIELMVEVAMKLEEDLNHNNGDIITKSKVSVEDGTSM